MSAAETEARTKHTEGPWKATIDDGRTIIHDDSFLSRHIAYLSNGGVPEAEEAANAALIAAAPEMLAALREAVEFAEQDHHALTPAGEAMLSRWRAAIAKAEG